MSLRYPFAIMKPGFNALVAPTPSYTYYIYGAGRNGQGQVGDLSTVKRSSPVQIGSASNWSSVFNAENVSLGLQTDGTLWTWGRNKFGTLGLSNQTYYSSPKQVGALTNWSSVS